MRKRVSTLCRHSENKENPGEQGLMMRRSWWILSPASRNGQYSDDKIGEKAEIYEAAEAC